MQRVPNPEGVRAKADQSPSFGIVCGTLVNRSVLLIAQGRRIILDRSPANNIQGHLVRAHVYLEAPGRARPRVSDSYEDCTRNSVEAKV